jgi:hypothetical protein
MSEKHLTEQLWKTVVAKQGVKDIGLGKALAAYNSLDAAKEPARALDALKEISELALKLKKANSAKEEVVTHLDEVVKEAKKATPGFEAKAKSATAAAAPTSPVEATRSAESSKAPNPVKTPETVKPAAEDPGEELDAAEFKQDLKRRMMSALAQVKALAPGESDQQKDPKPQLKFMAYLAGASCSVVVARMVGSAMKKLLPEIAGGVSGGKFVQGECIFEKNSHTFVLAEVPTGLAKKLAAALHSATAQKYRVRVRNTDGSLTTDSDADEDEAQAQTPPAAPAAPVADPEDTAKFTARFKALQPEMLKAIATKTPEAEEIKARAAEAGALANKKDFTQAHRALDTLEAMLKRVLATPAPATPPPAAKPPVAPPSPAASDAPGPRREIKLSTYLTGRANLRTARENAAKELQRLQQTILAKAADEPFFNEIQAKSQKLLDYLAPIDDSVANKLDEAGRCTDPEMQDELNKKVRELIQKQLSSLRGHPLASFVQANPFGKFIIRQPLEVTLSALDKQLS